MVAFREGRRAPWKKGVAELEAADDVDTEEGRVRGAQDMVVCCAAADVAAVRDADAYEATEAAAWAVRDAMARQ